MAATTKAVRARKLKNKVSHAGLCLDRLELLAGMNGAPDAEQRTEWALQYLEDTPALCRCVMTVKVVGR